MTTRSRQIRAAIGDATRAVSVHNSQPWRFVVGADAVEVHADTAVVPRIIDRAGRWVLESLGAATANLELGLRFRTGRSTRTTVLPEMVAGSGPTVSRSADTLLTALARAPIAVVELGPLTDRSAFGATDHEERRLYEAIPLRRTCRGPLYGELTASTWERLRAAGTLSGQGSAVRAVHPDAAAGARLVDLVAASEARWRTDVAYLAEIERWATRRDDRGIPPELIGPHDPIGGIPQRDFAVTPTSPHPDATDLARTDAFEVTPQLLALVGGPDEPGTWVRAGMAMQRVMLAATAAGAGVGVLGQVVEHDAARAEAGEVLGLRDGDVVQQLLRLGAVDATPDRPRTPRRPIHEVVTTRR